MTSVVKQKLSLFLTKSNVSEQKDTNTMCPLSTKNNYRSQHIAHTQITYGSNTVNDNVIYTPSY